MLDPTPALLPPAASIALIVGIGALVRAAVQAALRRRVLTPNAARRGVQAAAAALALSLPWLFDSAVPVVAVAAVLVAVLVAVRSRGAAAVSGLGASSTGSVAFPASVAALYVLAASTPVLYAIPLLLVGVAGPAASVAGARRGRTPFATVDGTKSVEGSVAFAAVAFGCVHVPLLLFTPVGRGESLVIAAVVAGLATMLEAVSWRGLDVLVVPLGAYALLLRLLTFSGPILAGHVLVLAGIAAAAAGLRRETTIGGAGVVAAALVAYLVWAVGGTAYLLAPSAVFLLYARVWPVAREADGLPHSPARRPHTAVNVFSVSAVGAAWLVAGRVLGVDLLAPYALAWAAAFALLGVERMRVARPSWGVRALAVRAAWRSALVAIAPVAIVWGLRAAADTGAPHVALRTAAFAVLALTVTAAAAAVLARFPDEIDYGTSDAGGRLARAALVAPLSALGLLRV